MAHVKPFLLCWVWPRAVGMSAEVVFKAPLRRPSPHIKGAEPEAFKQREDTHNAFTSSQPPQPDNPSRDREQVGQLESPGSPPPRCEQSPV